MKRKILLVEDDMIDRLAFKRFVKESDLSYEYMLAGSVAEARQILNAHQFDVVITDHQLGDGVAFDLFDMIVNTPIIFTTGSGDEAIAVQAMKKGAYEYLIKDQERTYLTLLPLAVENSLTQKHAQEQIRMLSHAMMNINDSVYITDLNGRVVFVNKAFCNTYGYEEDEILRQDSGILRSTDFKNTSTDAILLETPDGWQGDIYGKRKDGSEFPVSLSLSTIKNEYGIEVAIVGVARDITEKKQAENKLREISSQLLEANEQLAYLLKRFTPEKVAQKLINERNFPQPGGEQRRETTILFADMRNFTAAAESVGPERVLDILNAYLGVIGEIVQKYQGSVIQYVGDLVMVAFNVPDDQSDHPLRAAQAALEMRDTLEVFIAEQEAGGWPVLRFGFGLHTGAVVTGYLGAKDRYVYAAVGDATNVAFHICSQAAGGQIIISETTLTLLGDRARVKSLGAFPLKRRRDTFVTYELEGLSEFIELPVPRSESLYRR